MHEIGGPQNEFSIPTTHKISISRSAKSVKTASYTFKSKGSKTINEQKYCMPETLNSASRKIITADNEIQHTRIRSSIW